MPGENHAFVNNDVSIGIHPRIWFIHAQYEGITASGDSILKYPLSLRPSDNLNTNHFYRGKLARYSPFGLEIIYNSKQVRFVVPSLDWSRTDTLSLFTTRPQSRYSQGGVDVYRIDKTWEPVFPSINDSVIRASTALGPIVLSKSYGLISYPIVIDSLTGPDSDHLLGATLQQYFGPRHPLRQAPTTNQIFDLSVGDTLGYTYDNHSLFGLRNYRYVIKARQYDSAHGEKVYAVDYIYGMFGSTGLYHLINQDTIRIPVKHVLHSLAFTRKIPHFERRTVHGGEPWVVGLGQDTINVLGERHLWLNLYKGVWSYDTSGNTVYINAAIDSGLEEELLAPFGVIRSENSWGTGRLTCYRRRGVGVPCGPLNLVSTRGAIPSSLTLINNPVDNTLEIREAGAYALRLENLQGQLVRSATGTDKLLMEGLPSGLYVLRATDAHGRTATLRVVKQ